MRAMAAALFLALLAASVAPSAAELATPAWESCPVITPQLAPILPLMKCNVIGANATTAECATVQVPLHHDRPGTGSDDTIGFFVKRVHALQQPSKGEIWRSRGGGATMEWTCSSEVQGGVVQPWSA